MLFILIHFCSGLPMRGTEATSLKIFNSWNSLRNFFVFNGNIVAIAEYNKSQAVTETPRVIARFLPSEVSRLFISFIADVLPFLNLVEHDQDSLPESLPPSFIWQDKGAPWTSDHLSDIIGRETTTHLNCRLTLASWRQIAISIDQELLQDKAQSILQDHHNLIHTLQAGHSRETESHHYALSVDMIQGTSHKSLKLFLQVCQNWHHMLGFSSAIPPTPHINSKRKGNFGTGMNLALPHIPR